LYSLDSAELQDDTIEEDVGFDMTDEVRNIMNDVEKLTEGDMDLSDLDSIPELELHGS
jgi:hypothetical protein